MKKKNLKRGCYQQLRDLIMEIREELIMIQNSDAQMGCYDIEHLCKAQELTEETIRFLDQHTP